MTALFIAARLFAVIPVVGYIRAEHLDLLSIDHGIHAGADEVAGSILLDVPNPLVFACNVNILVPCIEYVLVGQLSDLAGDGGVTAGLFALRGLLAEGILGGLNGALEVGEAVGFLIGGSAPFKVGVAKRLFRAAGLALFPVARIVKLDGIHTLVGGEGAVIDMPAGLAGAGLDARILVGRLLLYHPAAENVILGLGAGLFGGAADAAGDVDVGKGDAATNGTVGIVEYDFYGISILIQPVDRIAVAIVVLGGEMSVRAPDGAFCVGDDAVVGTVASYAGVLGDGHHQIGGLRAGNSELAGTIGDYIHDLVSVGVIPLIAQLAGAVSAQRVAGLDHGAGVPLNAAFKIRRLADDVGLSVGFRAADLAVAVGVVTVHMGRNLPLGEIDIGHHIAAGLAGEIVNIYIGRRFGGVQHGRAFGVRRAVDQKAAVGADLPVSLPVALIGALFVMGAGDTVAVAAEVIGILAVSVLTALGTGLAQAAVVAKIQTGAVPAVIALRAAGQVGAARTVRSVAAIAAPALNAVVIVKVDVLVAVAAVVTVTLAAALADGVAAG